MGKPPPFFSVIIPTDGRPKQLAACLQALACIEYPYDCFEVVVVDDGSKTPPDSVVNSFRDKIDVTLLSQSHSGPAAARNAGTKQARGTFLAFTDDDCMPKADWLQKLAVHFTETPDALVGGRTLNALPDNRYSAASQMLVEYLYTYYNPTFDQACFLTSNNFAVSAARFRALGGFGTSFPLAAAEDRDFCDRWRDLGHQMIYAPEVLVYHAHSLTLRTFVGQHFRYGRGAFHFHQARTQRGQSRIRLEPTRFYVNLLRHRSPQVQGRNSLSLAVLLFVSQVANAAGFFWERGTKRSENKPSRVGEIQR